MQAHAGLQRTGNHDLETRCTGLIDNGQARSYATERLNLDHGNVAGSRVDDGINVGAASDAFIRGDLDAKPRNAPPKLGHVGHRLHGLFDIVEIEVLHVPDGVFGLIEGPGCVGIDADAAGGPQCLAHGSHAGNIIGSGRTSAGDFHFDGGGHAEAIQKARHRIRRDSRDGAIDPNGAERLFRLRRCRGLPSLLQSTPEPHGSFLVAVLEKWAPFRGPIGGIKNHDLPVGEPPKLGGQRHGDRVCHLAEVSKGGQAHAPQFSMLIPS